MRGLSKLFPPIVHPDDLALALELFQPVLQGEMPPVYELHILYKSGKYVEAEKETTRIDIGARRGI